MALSACSLSARPKHPQLREACSGWSTMEYFSPRVQCDARRVRGARRGLLALTSARVPHLPLAPHRPVENERHVLPNSRREAAHLPTVVLAFAAIATPGHNTSLTLTTNRDCCASQARHYTLYRRLVVCHACTAAASTDSWWLRHHAPPLLVQPNAPLLAAR